MQYAYAAASVLSLDMRANFSSRIPYIIYATTHVHIYIYISMTTFQLYPRAAGVGEGRRERARVVSADCKRHRDDRRATNFPAAADTDIFSRQWLCRSRSELYRRRRRRRRGPRYGAHSYRRRRVSFAAVVAAAVVQRQHQHHRRHRR